MSASRPQAHIGLRQAICGANLQFFYYTCIKMYGYFSTKYIHSLSGGGAGVLGARSGFAPLAGRHTGLVVKDFVELAARGEAALY